MSLKTELLRALDEAFDAEIRNVSGVAYNSNEICRWFYSNLRNRVDLSSSSLILEREEAGGETSDSSHLAVPTNGPESIGDAERTAAITAYLVLARKSGAWEPGSLPSDWEPDLLVFSPTQLYAFSRLLEAELCKKPSGLA